jgi:hypothetical protein
VSRKRGNGEGTIHRRKDGGWCAQYTVYTAEGRKRKTIYGKTRAEVGGKLAKALSDARAASSSTTRTSRSASISAIGWKVLCEVPCGRAPSTATR